MGNRFVVRRLKPVRRMTLTRLHALQANKGTQPRTTIDKAKSPGLKIDCELDESFKGCGRFNLALSFQRTSVYIFL